MPLQRDARLDRRRRLLREGADPDENPPVGGGSQTRRSRPSATVEQPLVRKSAGYSQDVRGACGQRLVQLIPVRRRSLAAVIVASFFIPVLLMYAHYMVYVSGQWPWYGHPLALCLDTSHPQGMAAWFSSHLWLLCLGTTILTFQLRRHKLDDYRGEYRLWFWLVVTCLLGSLDATTHISELFAASIDGWSRGTLGWSGPAVFRSVIAVLIGLLGLRMCSELKVVPFSLVLWLVGLTAWVASAALARDEFRLDKFDLTIQHRIWLRCGLWLCGLAAIWLAGLTYLRHVYIEAQRRFLLRGKLASSAATVGMSERVRCAWQALPALPRLSISAGQPTEQTQPAARKLEKIDAPSARPRRVSNQEAASPTASKRRWGLGWLRRAKDDDEAAEYRKLAKGHPITAPESRQDYSPGGADDKAQGAKLRRWLPRIAAPQFGKLALGVLAKLVMPRRMLPKLGVPKLKLPKLSLPKLNLSGLRLKPPQDDSGVDASSTSGSAGGTGIRPVDQGRPLPGTSAPGRQALTDRGDDDELHGLSKAERKRLRRQQQQNRAA
jgi:hypothetical protein